MDEPWIVWKEGRCLAGPSLPALAFFPDDFLGEEEEDA